MMHQQEFQRKVIPKCFPQNTIFVTKDIFLLQNIFNNIILF